MNEGSLRKENYEAGAKSQKDFKRKEVSLLLAENKKARKETAEAVCDKMIEKSDFSEMGTELIKIKKEILKEL